MVVHKQIKSATDTNRNIGTSTIASRHAGRECDHRTERCCNAEASTEAETGFKSAFAQLRDVMVVLVRVSGNYVSMHRMLFAVTTLWHQVTPHHSQKRKQSAKLKCMSVHNSKHTSRPSAAWPVSCNVNWQTHTGLTANGNGSAKRPRSEARHGSAE